MVSVGQQEVDTLFFLGPRAGNKNGKSSITLLTWPSQIVFPLICLLLTTEDRVS